MPQINISEIDSTSPGSLNASTYAVLIPGPCANAVKGEEYDFVAIDAVVDEAGDTFKSLFEYEGVEDNISYKMAYHLLKLGMPVHYVVIDDEEELKNYKFWEKFEDKGLYDINFITSANYRGSEIATNIAKCAAERGDAIGLIDIPEPSESGAEYNSEYIKDWIENNIEEVIVERAVENPNNEVPVKESSLAYGAVFAPDISFDDPYFENTVYPATFGYLVCFAAHNISEYPAWFATAGAVRGVLPYSNVEVEFKFGEADSALLQNRTDLNRRAANLIQKVRPYGNIIYGARTLFPNKADDNGIVGLVASSFLNIRELCCLVKKRLYAASRRYTFDPNSDTLWANFKATVSPLLEEMKSGQGIKGYKFIKEASTKKGTLKARIQIIPIEPVEDFYLTVNIVDSIVEVSE